MAYGFDGGNYHHLYETEGKEPIDGTFHFTRHSFLGAEYNDGKADAFRKVKAGIDVEGLQEQSRGWENVHTHLSGISTRLDKAYSDLFSEGWDGDDADKARKTFGDTSASVRSIRDSSSQMSTGTKRIADAAAKACGTGSDGPSGGAQFVNAAIGPFGGNGDGDADEQAYFTLVGEVDGGRDAMPQQVEWQAKPDPGNSGYQGSAPPTTSGGSGVGGVSAPGASGAPQHLSTRSPGLTKPPDIKHPGTGHPGTDHPGTDSTGSNGSTGGLDGSGLTGADTSPYGAGSGGAGSYTGSTPGLDTSSSLAGYDPSGGAGAAGLAGGGSGAGGFGGGGLGAGSSSAGLGSGVGAGLAGSGSAGALGAGGLGAGGLAGSGPTGGRGSGVSGAGGRGGVAGQVAPMRGGGGAGGDDSERERSTWLHEDDDVWGESDAPPSVIS